VQSKTIRFHENEPALKDESTPNAKLLLEKEREEQFL